MALPSSGPLSLTDIQTEFGGTAPIGLNEYYRGGAYVTPNNTNVPTSGQIAVNNFYGAVRRITVPLSISSPAYNYDVYSNRGPSYIAGISDVTLTVDSGVLVGSTSTAAYAMLVPGSFSPGDTVTIVNNGVIEGMGGNGGDAIYSTFNPGGNPGFGAGNALYVNTPVTIQNNSVIAGGGGGGGGASGYRPNKGSDGWGGGGGGGAGFNAGTGGAGPYGGSPGDSTNGGAGGVGDVGLTGGTGGGRGANGAAGDPFTGANPRPGGAGGAAGYYLNGNPFVTWSATGTRQGPSI